MAIQRRVQGAATAWTTSQPIPFSTAQTAGDICYLVAGNAAAIGTAPAGWTEVASAGPIASYYGKVFKLACHPGGTPTAPTVTASGGSGGVAWIEHFYSDAGGTTVLRGYSEQMASDTDTSSTAFSASGSSITTTNGEALLATLLMKCTATMTANPASPVVTQASATMGTQVGNFLARLSSASPTNSVAYGSYHRPVTTGASGIPSFTATAGTGGTGAGGMVGLIRLREITNTAPTANAGSDQAKNSGDLVTLNGTASSDADGDTITYAWTHSSGPYAGSLSLSTAASPTYTATGSGTDIWSLTVTDMWGLASSADTVNIVVTAANVPPTANAGVDQSVLPGITVTLNGTGSTDSDGTISAYTWTPASGITLSSNTVASPTFTAPYAMVDQSYIFSLVVTDNNLANSASDSVTITVYAHQEWYFNGTGWKPELVNYL